MSKARLGWLLELVPFSADLDRQGADIRDFYEEEDLDKLVACIMESPVTLLHDLSDCPRVQNLYAKSVCPFSRVDSRYRSQSQFQIRAGRR